MHGKELGSLLFIPAPTNPSSHASRGHSYLQPHLAYNPKVTLDPIYRGVTSEDTVAPEILSMCLPKLDPKTKKMLYINFNERFHCSKEYSKESE